MKRILIASLVLILASSFSAGAYTEITTYQTTHTVKNTFLHTEYDYSESDSYRGFLNFGYDWSGTKSYTNNFTIRTTHGYQTSRNFFLGVGVGLDFPMGNVNHTPNLPVYGDLRLQANKKHLRLVPMVDLKVGYCFNHIFAEDTQSYEDMLKGGLYVNPSVGFSYVINKYIGINLAVGYSFYKYKRDEPIGDLYYTNRQGVTLEVGFDF